MRDAGCGFAISLRLCVKYINTEDAEVSRRIYREPILKLLVFISEKLKK